MIGTGNGVVVQVSGDFGAGAENINIPNALIVNGASEENESVDTANLSHSGPGKSVPGDVPNPGDFDVQFQWDPKDGASTEYAKLFGVVRGRAIFDVTITFPQQDAVTPASIAGSAFFIRRTTPSFENNSVMVGTVGIKWDGYADATHAADGPVYTAAAFA